MSIKPHPRGFKLDFGSTVTILTTAVADTKHCKRVSGQGIFTGVVLEESELRLKRSPKHILISMNGLNEFQDDSKNEGADCCCHAHKCDDKQNDWEGHQPHYQEDCGQHKNDYECEVKTHLPHNNAYVQDWKNECEVRTTQECVILSLTCSSFPFTPGQVVWISLDQIIALTVLCKD